MTKIAPMVWRKIADRYALVGSHCQNCKSEFFPQRKFCPKCRRHGRIVQKHMPTQGRIFSWTRVHSAPAGLEHETPYFLAIIELANGVKLMTQIVDSPQEKIREGAPVGLVFRRIAAEGEQGLIVYGFKFKVI